MGRRENPVASCDRELEKLARWLRSQRASADLKYEELAARSGYSASTLVRTASGQQVPKWHTTRAYAVACGADVGRAEQLWKRARYRAVRSADAPAPHPRYVRSFADLRAALVDLYERNGARPYRELEKDGGRSVKRSTVGRFIRKDGVLPTREFVRGFAEACGTKGVRALQEWEKAWDRAEEDRQRGSSTMPTRRLPSFAGTAYGGQHLPVYSDPARSRDGREVRRFSVDVDPAVVGEGAFLDHALTEILRQKAWEYLDAQRGKRRRKPSTSYVPAAKRAGPRPSSASYPTGPATARP